ncbi:MAG: tRNA (adenosine(37)-N6)-threonylcarbamoyltransferase complex transferase subunit TsaD [Clostridiales Family XIII bacterium]|jgi:N6-L-threonylcarbamoyladenine synthase|nr:tRNA (adenosine(37)-N6)-threonylcarbamoyltransferase complex transferase subunit TsaD [Clostridiales Family XIII bacterium]
MVDGKFLTLGIESSCDETAAAVVADGREVLSNPIASQIDVHEVFGGVVPEIASRHHLVQVNGIVDAALSDAGVRFSDIDLIGVTEGPGLIGAVLIGLSTAKALSFSLGIPFVGVHHIKGHIHAAFLEHKNLKPPFLSLIVSGGHTDFIDVQSYSTYHLLGQTRDDAVGEAYDKVARVLGLGYPGGPKVEKAAKDGDPDKIFFKRALLEDGSLDFSFSGIKTGVLNYANTEKQAGRPINIADVAAGFQASVLDVLVQKTELALEKTGYDKMTLGGGVASNAALRERLKRLCEQKNVHLYIPSPVYCTDNAAMIACAGYYTYQTEGASPFALDAKASLSL